MAVVLSWGPKAWETKLGWSVHLNSCLAKGVSSLSQGPASCLWPQAALHILAELMGHARLLSTLQTRGAQPDLDHTIFPAVSHAGPRQGRVSIRMLWAAKPVSLLALVGLRGQLGMNP